MPEMQLWQLGFKYSTSGQFTKNKERIHNFKETLDSRYFHQNKLDKACFQQNIAYWDFKDLSRVITCDKIYLIKRSILQKVFSVLAIKSEIISKQKLAEELHKLIIKKCEHLKYTNLLKIISVVLVLPISIKN